MSVKPITSRQAGELSRLLEERGVSSDEYQRLIEHPDEVVSLIKSSCGVTLGQGWVEELMMAENAAHLTFFGQFFDLTRFRQRLSGCGEKKIREWQKLGLDPHFLPPVTFTQDSEFLCWEVRPENWYWQQLASGKILRRNAKGDLVPVREAKLDGAVVLIDTRLKPHYDDGKQMFAADEDFLGNIIANLRRQRKIAHYDYGPQTSRFGISANEWQDHVRLAVAELLQLNPSQVRLELALEANVIPQLYPTMPRRDDGNTNTSCWYEEYFAGVSARLRGGDSGHGGLFSVSSFGSVRHCFYGCVRPLVVLAS